MENIRLISFAVRLIIYMSCYIDYSRENGDRRMEYLSIRQTTDKWVISSDVEKPKDERVKIGKYIKSKK
jgi:hypothetical protein